MRLLDRVSAWLRGPTPSPTDGPSRRERRAAGRARHRQTGALPWTANDRQVAPPDERWVADVAPGTPGHDASVHTVKDR